MFDMLEREAEKTRAAKENIRELAKQDATVYFHLTVYDSPDNENLPYTEMLSLLIEALVREKQTYMALYASTLANQSPPDGLPNRRIGSL